MKNPALISCLFFLLNFISIQGVDAVNSLLVQDPQATWRRGTGTIDSATLILKPKGLFIEHSIYLNFSAKKLNFGVKDTLEVIFNFDLPENAVITDSWLWLTPEQIIQGKLLDIWTATGIYENIVKRRRDPSILKKINKTQYELRIFPMAGNSYRKVKITYLVPGNIVADELKTPVVANFLSVSLVPLANLNLLYIPQAKYGNPQLTSNLSSERFFFWEQTDPVIGRFLYKPITVQTLTNQPQISIPLDQAYNSLYSVYTKNNESYFQLAVKLNSIIEKEKNKKIMIVVDYFASNAISIELLMQYLEDHLLKYISPDISFNIAYTKKLNYTLASENWITATPQNIKDHIAAVKKEVSFGGSTVSLLNNSIQYLKSHGNEGVIYFLSSGNMYPNTSLSNLIIDELKGVGIESFPTHIVDICNSALGCVSVTGTVYCNNQYLYSNLARISKGTYTKLESPYTATADVMSSGLNKSLGSILNLDFYSSVENGFCYQRYLDKEVNQYTISDYVIQVGKFTGSLPLSVVVSGFLDNRVFSTKATIPLENEIPADGTNVQIWAGFLTRDLEKNTGNTAITNIIQSSIENHVLSLYTSFLCLEDTSYFCANCVDETKLNTGSEDVKSQESWTVFPNPFSNKVKIQISDFTISNSDKISISIYNLQGLKVDEIHSFTREQNQLYFDWLPNSHMPSGIYMCVIRIGSKIYKQKVVKI